MWWEASGPPSLQPWAKSQARVRLAWQLVHPEDCGLAVFTDLLPRMLAAVCVHSIQATAICAPPAADVAVTDVINRLNDAVGDQLIGEVSGHLMRWPNGHS